MMIPVAPNPLNQPAMTTKNSDEAMGGAGGLVKNFKNEVTLQR